ncbi:hypothetical protein GDO81_022947 [Engystomops pustulosus]|uniref:Secreted protein n=1 Tax=Engystomops pustulosus TaxID=76066 RepID=A0AAV6ZWC7_ENGPU|nr:hypothetical protein GDO81_022947 [Engystomops pustulosus]
MLCSVLTSSFPTSFPCSSLSGNPRTLSPASWGLASGMRCRPVAGEAQVVEVDKVGPQGPSGSTNSQWHRGPELWRCTTRSQYGRTALPSTVPSSSSVKTTW